MFGLMKSIKNSTSTESYREDYRLHYCGTCKTMGKNYGQRTRVLLNHDVVFLGQLLSAINKEQETEHWDSQYYSKNCFALPRDEAQMPKVLQYAAAINVMLGALKIEDNILDTKKGAKKAWKAARTVLKSKVKKTESTLKTWSFPVDVLWKWTHIQLEREIKQPTFSHSKQALDYFAQPTAIMTALVFKHGAKMVNQPSIQGTLFDLGYTFGQLIYWLDALEDFEKDVKAHKFNGIQAVYATTGNTLSEKVHQAVIQLIHNCQANFDQIIAQLPMEDKWKVQFSYQLNKNLSLRLKGTCCENSCDTSTPKLVKPLPKLSIKEKWQTAKDISQQTIYRSQDICERASLFAALKHQIMYSSLVGILFITPSATLQSLSQQSHEVWTYGALIATGLGAAFLGSQVWKSLKAPCSDCDISGCDLSGCDPDCYAACFCD